MTLKELKAKMYQKFTGHISEEEKNRIRTMEIKDEDAERRKREREKRKREEEKQKRERDRMELRKKFVGEREPLRQKYLHK